MNNNSLKVVRELFDKNIKESNSEANQEKIIQLDRIMSSIGESGGGRPIYVRQYSMLHTLLAKSSNIQHIEDGKFFKVYGKLYQVIENEIEE